MARTWIEDSIDWCRENLNFAHFRVGPPAPPMPYSDSHFDLVYAISCLHSSRGEASILLAGGIGANSQRQWIVGSDGARSLDLEGLPPGSGKRTGRSGDDFSLGTSAAGVSFRVGTEPVFILESLSRENSAGSSARLFTWIKAWAIRT